MKFFVGPTDGWGIGDVTVTNLTTSELTVLQPTATGDFGNDYEFVMPAANVHIVANFLPPYTIHTVVNPEQGGAFNFVSGYNDFNGQTTSNSGKVVTFTVEPEDNYYLSSVTYTDNETGETVTMTPDGNGVYSFVMPANDVTLEATFLVQPNELYLLGTSMGRISWCAAGPKFQFDGTNYYLDVYFKGGNENPSVDQAYGYFSLSKRIDTSIDWRTAASGAGDWGVMNGMRLAATSNNYLVGDGSTGVVLSGNNPDNAFKIPAGIYRITVSGDMSTMSIRQTPVTLTITCSVCHSAFRASMLAMCSCFIRLKAPSTRCTAYSCWRLLSARISSLLSRASRSMAAARCSTAAAAWPPSATPPRATTASSSKRRMPRPPRPFRSRSARRAPGA